MRSLVAKGVLALAVAATGISVGTLAVRNVSTTARPTCATTSDAFDANRLPSSPTRQWAADGEVDAVLRCGRTVYVGGEFDVIGPYTGGFASVSARTGSADQAMPILGRDVTAITSEAAADGSSARKARDWGDARRSRGCPKAGRSLGGSGLVRAGQGAREKRLDRLRRRKVLPRRRRAAPESNGAFDPSGRTTHRSGRPA